MSVVLNLSQSVLFRVSALAARDISGRPVLPNLNLGLSFRCNCPDFHPKRRSAFSLSGYLLMLQTEFAGQKIPGKYYCC